jgi:ATP-binding cassette subfamily B protein
MHSRLVRNYRIAVIETVIQAEKLRRTSYSRDVPTTPGAALAPGAPDGRPGWPG